MYLEHRRETTKTDRKVSGVTTVIPPLYYVFSNPLALSARETVLGGQFDWGGRLLKSNGGAQRYPQHVWKSCIERNGIRVLDCESYNSSR